MTAYSEVSLVRRRKLLITYVKCKLLLQQSIPTKTFGVVEVSIIFNGSIIVNDIFFC